MVICMRRVFPAWETGSNWFTGRFISRPRRFFAVLSTYGQATSELSWTLITRCRSHGVSALHLISYSGNGKSRWHTDVRRIGDSNCGHPWGSSCTPKLDLQTANGQRSNKFMTSSVVFYAWHEICHMVRFLKGDKIAHKIVVSKEQSLCGTEILHWPRQRCMMRTSKISCTAPRKREETLFGLAWERRKGMVALSNAGYIVWASVQPVCRSLHSRFIQKVSLAPVERQEADWSRFGPSQVRCVVSSLCKWDNRIESHC